MNPNMMTQSVLLMLQRSQEIALKAHHQQLTHYHLLKGILDSKSEYVIDKCLEGINAKKLSDLCDEKLSKIPEIFGEQQSLTLSNELSQLFMKMEDRATKNGDKFISLDNMIWCLFSNEPIKSLFI